jgi:hypothetical protein
MLKGFLSCTLGMLLLGCRSAQPAQPLPAAMNVVQTEAEAIAIAQRFLDQQSWADQYLPGTAAASEHPTFWLVLVEHVDAKHRLPGHGAIVVDKRSAAAEWQPLR